MNVLLILITVMVMLLVPTMMAITHMHVTLDMKKMDCHVQVVLYNHRQSFGQHCTQK